MPGRQAHGRSLVSAPKAKKGGKSSKNRAQKNALNAFGIAQEHFPAKEKKTPRFRAAQADIERKHARDDDEDDEDEDEDEDQPQRKKAKRPSRPADPNAEFGSDSEGNEWQLGGMAEDDEDSEIDSDDAFGDSDDGKFDEYAFRGSKSQNKDDDSEDDPDDDEGETLGEEAIDLATALDQWEESDDEPQANNQQSDSDDSGSEGSDESEEQDDDAASDDEGDEADPAQLETLRGLVSGFGGEDDDKDKAPTKQKIDLGDLGLSGIDDPFMKNSVKLMNKESKEKRPGASKKLDVPLSRREQGRIDRSAAYDKTNETLDRWTETVKANRRAEHLVFPLPQSNNNTGLDTTEIQPMTAKNNNHELESAIFSIMDQSGLSMEKPKKEKEPVYDEEGNELTRKEIINQKRQERERQAREAKRAARVKKIKSKAYHRVHRKQKERDDMAMQEARAEAGEIDSEEEREAQDRRRALERVGQRHKDSKWAKMGAKNKRAVWDEDFRAGLTEMARQDQDLRRRKEGKGNVSDSDETSSSGSDSEDGGAASIRRDIAALEAEDEEPKKGLMSMKFMQKAEAAKKLERDELKRQLNSELAELNGEEVEAEDSDEGTGEIGRRQYGDPSAVAKPALNTSNRKAKKREDNDDDDEDVTITLNGHSTTSGPVSASSNAWTAAPEATADSGAWSTAGPKSKGKKKGSAARDVNLDVVDSIGVQRQAKKPPKPTPSTTSTAVVPRNGANHNDDDSESESDQHLPMAIRDRELLDKAFAGDDVQAEFEQEKEAIAADDDDKVIDNTLPGWGSWVGDGVSNREKKRHQGRFLTKVEGIKKKDRKDAKLDKVIINEKRVKKNDQYLASQLPFPFESRAQYERSLRLPVGPEWQTKETFQDSTKPRVIVKQGIIAPIHKPTR